MRYELELKGQLAFAEASRLAASRSRERAIADSLIAFFEVDRGLNGLLRAGLEPNQPIGCLIPYAGLTDHNRSLSWLATCVRPTVQKLIRAGKLDAVLDALGLDNQARGSNGPQKTRPADQWPNRR